jgi:outer membrane protein assembly factor BamB
MHAVNARQWITSDLLDRNILQGIILRFTAPIAALLWLGASPAARDWPQFRGPAGRGVSDETGLQLTWSATSGVAWKAALPGPGHSSPIIWRDRIFLTAFRSSEGALGRMTSMLTSKLAMGHRPTGQLLVLCLDRATGRVVWQREVETSAIEEVHHTNSPATPTPVTDGSLVYVYFGSRGLFAYDFDGKLVWEKPLGPFPNEWGSGSSPVLYDDLLLLNIDSDGDDFLLAVDKRSGKTVWQAPRTNAPRAWPTPAVWRKPDGDEIVVSGSARASGYDARTGTERWRVNGLSSWVSPTPLVAHGLLYVASGGSGGNVVLAIRPGGRGDVTTTHVVWRTERVAPYISSPVVAGDLLFTVRDGGIVACLDAKSGRLIWQQRLAAAGSYYASPLAADGRIYVTNEDGVVTVLAAKPSFQVLAVNDLGERTLASPAVSDRTIFLRSDEHLWAIR